MEKRILTFWTLFSLLTLNSLMAQSNQVVLKTDFSGQIVAGSIDSLLDEISQGAALRVGWQLDFNDDGISDLEHWIDAEFISILNGQVFNQIRPIYRQIPNQEIPQVQILNSNIQWTAIIGTNGKLISRYIIPDLHLIEDEKIKANLEQKAEVSERMVATIWVTKE